MVFSKKEINSNKILLEEIRTKEAKCGCDKKLVLSEWNKHIANCKTHLGKINNVIKSSVIQDKKE